MWFLIGAGLSHVVVSLRVGSRFLSAAIPIALVVVIMSTAMGQAPRLPSLLTYALEGKHGRLFSRMMMQTIHNIELDEPVLFLGTFDQFNVGMARWLAAAITGRGPSQVPIYAAPPPHVRNACGWPTLGERHLPDSTTLKRLVTMEFFSQIVIIRGPEHHATKAAALQAAESTLGGFVSEELPFSDEWSIRIIKLAASTQGPLSE